MSKPQLIHITTVPLSLDKLLEGHLRCIQHYIELVAASIGGAAHAAAGKCEGGLTAVVAMRRQNSRLKDIKALWQLHRFLKKEDTF